LWTDDAGLAVLRGVAVRAGALLRPEGWFGVEHGETQGRVVRQILSCAGWRDAVTHPDLAGRDRFTTVRRR
ncbi:MAG: hypothetical protein ACRDQZ_06975, partial [Mycobacteriales bacterium]